MIRLTTKGATQIDARMNRRIAKLADLQIPLAKAAEIVCEATRQRFDSSGDGEWEPLAESTVQRKASQGSGDAARILYESGNLYESVTSPGGAPYGYIVYPTPHSVVFGVDWSNGGYQIPMVLSEGAGAGGRFPQGAHPGDWHIPARRIYPRAEVMAVPVGAAIMAYLRV